MSKKAFDSIMAGLQDALAYTKGDKTRGRATAYDVGDLDVGVDVVQPTNGPRAISTPDRNFASRRPLVTARGMEAVHAAHTRQS